MQSTASIIPAAQKLFLQNPNRSVSATFRFLRKKSNLSELGDYPILATLVYTIQEMGINLNRQKLTHAFNTSSELSIYPKKMKMSLLDQLQNHATVQSKLPKIHVKQMINEKVNNDSLKQQQMPLHAQNSNVIE